MLDEDKLMMLWHLIHHHLSHDCILVYMYWPSWWANQMRKRNKKVYDENRSAVISDYYAWYWINVHRFSMIITSLYKCFGFAAEYWTDDPKKLYRSICLFWIVRVEAIAPSSTFPPWRHCFSSAITAFQPLSKEKPSDKEKEKWTMYIYLSF